MSEIDTHPHQCIGVITCPSTYEIVAGNDRHRDIPLYLLDEDAPEWSAKAGDLVLGGGAGESAALRIALPEAIRFVTQEAGSRDLSGIVPFKAYWSATQAFVFGEGYARLGWHPGRPIEVWLTEQIVAFLLREYPAVDGVHKGPKPPREGGSLCRLPRLTNGADGGLTSII